MLQEAKKLKLPIVNEDYLKQVIKTDLGGNDTELTDFEVVSAPIHFKRIDTSFVILIQLHEY
jgi:hypothetical protein